MRKLELYNPIYFMKEDSKLIYRVDSVEEVGSFTHALRYNMSLVAGYDYVEPDYSDKQGWVSKEAFVEEIQDEDLLVYPLEESLLENAESEGYKFIHIEDYYIHPYK